MNKIELFRTTPRIVMGNGAIETLGEEARNLEAEKVLFVTDKGVMEAGLITSALKVLEKNKIEYAIFDTVEPDPRYEIVANCVEMIKKEDPGLLVGFGGDRKSVV